MNSRLGFCNQSTYVLSPEGTYYKYLSSRVVMWMPWLLVNLHCKSTQHLQLLTTMPMFIYIVIDYQNEQWHRYHWKSVICSHHEGFMKGFIGRKNYSGSQEVKNLVLLSLAPSPGDWNISLSALLQFWSSDISEAKLLVLTGKKVAYELNSHPPHVHLRNKWAQVFFAALLLLCIILNEQKQTKKIGGGLGTRLNLDCRWLSSVLHVLDALVSTWIPINAPLFSACAN